MTIWQWEGLYTNRSIVRWLRLKIQSCSDVLFSWICGKIHIDMNGMVLYYASRTSHCDTSQASRESENVNGKWSFFSIPIVYVFFSFDYYSFSRHTLTKRHSFKNILKLKEGQSSVKTLFLITISIPKRPNHRLYLYESCIV